MALATILTYLSTMAGMTSWDDDICDEAEYAGDGCILDNAIPGYAYTERALIERQKVGFSPCLPPF